MRESGDVAHLPYPDDSFDVVVSTISMHHWVELEQPLRDLHWVLQPGGWLWIYDFRFVKAQTVEQALARTPFAGTLLEHLLVRTGRSLFALYRRFALQKTAHGDLQSGEGSQTRPDERCDARRTRFQFVLMRCASPHLPIVTKRLKCKKCSFTHPPSRHASVGSPLCQYKQNSSNEERKHRVPMDRGVPAPLQLPLASSSVGPS